MAASAPDARPLTGRGVLMIIVGFFGVVFAMNGVFLYQALHSYSGVVSNEPYRKGIEYNRRIEADAEQAKLGWTGDVALSPDRRLTVDIRDRDGKALSGLSIAATVGRPATMSENLSLTLAETSAGRYEAAAGVAGSGAFIADIEATATGTLPASFKMRRRLWLAP